MANQPPSISAARLQSNLSMLKSSLKQVFPTTDECAFGELLRQLDRGPSLSR